MRKAPHSSGVIRARSLRILVATIEITIQSFVGCHVFVTDVMPLTPHQGNPTTRTSAMPHHSNLITHHAGRSRRPSRHPAQCAGVADAGSAAHPHPHCSHAASTQQQHCRSRYPVPPGLLPVRRTAMQHLALPGGLDSTERLLHLPVGTTSAELQHVTCSR